MANVTIIEPIKVQNSVPSNRVEENTLMGDIEPLEKNISKKFEDIAFNELPYNILLGASERFNELRFDIVKEKYPNVKSLKEFLTSDNYLGNSELEI